MPGKKSNKKPWKQSDPQPETTREEFLVRPTEPEKPEIVISEPDKPEPDEPRVSANMVERHPDAFVSEAEPTYVVTRASAMYVRETPAQDGKILYAVPKGHRFILVNKTVVDIHTWCRVRSIDHPTGEGYVMEAYVEIEKEVG